MAIVNGKNRHPTANQRLEIMQAVERSGNVSQACLQYEVSRASYYAWLRKYKEAPLSGLEPKKRISKRANKTPQDVVERVVVLAIRNPDSGCSKIADLLLKGGTPLSPPTVQKILNKEGLGTVSRRLFRLEKHYVLDGWQVTDQQLELINRNDPCLKERNKTGSHPGEILVQDCFPIFQLIPGCYVHVVIDTYSSTAFVYPWFEKSSFIAADVLHALAFRKFRLANFPIRKVVTSNAYIFSRHGKTYSDICMSRNVLHEIYTGKDRNWNGYIESFKKFFLNKYQHLKTEKLDAAQLTEIFRTMKHPSLCGSIAVQGFPNFGMTPAKRIEQSRSSLTK